MYITSIRNMLRQSAQSKIMFIKSINFLLFVISVIQKCHSKIQLLFLDLEDICTYSYMPDASTQETKRNRNE